MRREAEWIAKAGATNAIALATRDNISGGRHVITQISASFSGASTKLLQLYEAQDDSVLVDGTIAIDSTAEKFQTTTAMYYSIAGVSYVKAATTAIAFSAAHPVTASKFGAILLQIDAAGTPTTLISGATQTTTQAYATAAAAVAALPSPTAGSIKYGHIIIEADSGGWTAITDDLTDGSDLTTATFVDASETGTLRYEDYVVNALALEIPTGIRALENNRTVVGILAASGTGGMVGKVNLTGYTI